jgi:galactokinase
VHNATSTSAESSTSESVSHDDKWSYSWETDSDVDDSAEFLSKFTRGHWSQYLYNTWTRLRFNFPSCCFGKDQHTVIVFGSDLPAASGMSSSSAFVVGSYLLARDQQLDEKMEECGLLPFGQLTPLGGLAPRGDSVLGKWKHTAEKEVTVRQETVEQEISLSFYEYVPSTQVEHLDELYSYLGCCENGQALLCQNGHTLPGMKWGGVGTFGGSEDHAAILGCVKGHLSYFAFCPTQCKNVVLWNPKLAMVIASSGIEAEKTTAKLEEFNNAVFMARAAHKTLSEFIRNNTAEGKRAGHRVEGLTLWQASNLLMEILSREPSKPPFDISNIFDEGRESRVRVRFEHLLHEMELLQGFLHHYAQKDYHQLQKCVQRSQHLTETLLKNTVPETRFLPACAVEEGAVAASAFGAGFGGSVYALIEAEKADNFANVWEQKYVEAFPGNKSKARFLVMKSPPGGAIQFLRLSPQ